MRPELSQLEKITQYLSGDLDANQVKVFEQELANNKELNDLVSQQKDLIQAAKRKALRAEIESVAAGVAGGGSGASLFSAWVALGGAIVVGLGITLYLTLHDDIQELKQSQLSFSEVENIIPMDSPDNSDETDSENHMKNSLEELVLEEPETVFLSVANYVEESEDMTSKYDQPLIVSQEQKNHNPSSKNGSGVVIKEKTKADRDKNESIVEVYENNAMRATYPGGNLEMKRFMDKNLRYPKSAFDKGIQAVAQCDFQITADGIIQNINPELIKMSEADGMPFNDVRILFNKKLADAFIGNATHVLRTMPLWKPAKNSAGTPVMSTQRIYFKYDLIRGCLAYQLSDDFELPISE